MLRNKPSISSAELVIEATDLVEKFRKICIVDNVNLRIPKGTIYGFLVPKHL
ncbi:hypothetical protein GCM10011346_19740 [Oceanobacillus neutriphilus]|uniref:Uncharacterized protein n=1 Tax=Oceanobacillus neutriphilus TaxID=531815 RepID=A0ABQ2NUB0_9BACI|nr:hypothetical protein GCM10011346_19740 [Oceanobacillus neutriphilus]